MNGRHLLIAICAVWTSSCTLQGPQPIAVGPAAYPPGQPGGGFGGPAGPVQAGCTLNSNELQGAPGQTFQLACPPGCAAAGGLWGTDIYTGDSAVCHAGIHAGAISPDGGVLWVRIEQGQPAYRGSARNGVESHDYGSYGSSFTVAPANGQPAAAAPPPGQPVAAGYYAQPPQQPAAPQAIDAGCSFGSRDIKDVPGSSHLVSCPPGCADTGGLWGTDRYTGDSSICKAAIHSGFITNEGGNVVVILDGPQQAFRGSTRNKVQSHDYGSYSSSFRLQKP